MDSIIVIWAFSHMLSDWFVLFSAGSWLLEDLKSPASILITVAVLSSPAEHSVTAAGLDPTTHPLFKAAFLHPLSAGVSEAEVKISLNVARERLMVFVADTGFVLRWGVGAPSGGIGEIDWLLFWGVLGPGDLIRLGCFFLSLRGLTSCLWGCEEPLSTSSDDSLTTHQLPVGCLLRFSRFSGPGCSSDFLGESAAGLDFFPLVPCWYTLWNTWTSGKDNVIPHYCHDSRTLAKQQYSSNPAHLLLLLVW